MTKYLAVATALGVGWFVVLLLPSVTRGWFLEQAPLNLALLTAASVIVAWAFRGYIRRANTLRGHLVRGAIIPYIGCIVYLSLFATAIWIEHFTGGGLANWHDTGSLFAMGVTAALVSCFVVVPYGLLCQYALHAAS